MTLSGSSGAPASPASASHASAKRLGQALGPAPVGKALLGGVGDEAGDRAGDGRHSGEGGYPSRGVLPCVPADPAIMRGGMDARGGLIRKYVAAYAVAVAGILLVPASALAAPPANDDFANAQQLSGGLPLNYSGSLVDDTREAGEPADHGEGRGATAGTVWYSWTATQTGTVRARFRSTSGLAFNSVSPATDDRPFLAAYTGSAVNALTPVPFTSPTILDGDRGTPIEFNVTSGTEYHFVVESFGQGTFDAQVRAVDAPANDDFADRIELTGASPSFSGNNFDATAEPSEPYALGTHTLWYEWTAAQNGVTTVRYDTADFASPRFGFEFHHVFAVYQGSALNALTQVSDESANPGPGGGYMARFDGIAGETYLIQVVVGASEGPFSATLEQTPAPANDSFSSPTALSGASPIDVSGSVAGATEQPGEPGYTAASNGGTVWYSWTAPVNGVAFLEGNSNLNSQIRAYTGATVGALTEVTQPDGTGFDAFDFSLRSLFLVNAGTTYWIRYRNDNTADNFTFRMRYATRAPNDDFEDATTMTGTSPAVEAGSLAGATKQAGEPDLVDGGLDHRASTWYEWTAPDDLTVKLRFVDGNGNIVEPLDGPSVKAYSGAAVNALTDVSRRAIVGRGDRKTFSADAGTTYHIMVGSYFRDAYNLRLRAAEPPANDHFADATELTGAHPTAPGSMTGATLEPNEPTYSGFGGDEVTAWYEWTAPASGRGRVRLTSEDFVGENGNPLNISKLAVFTGNALNSLTLVSPGFSGDGIYRWDVDAGTVYRIAVVSTSAGPFTIGLDFSPAPPNDDLANAAPLTGAFPREASGDIAGARDEPGEPDHAGAAGGRSAWYSFTPADSGHYRASACQRSFNPPQTLPIVAVYTGAAFGSLNQVAATNAGQCATEFDGVAGTPYLIAVDYRTGNPLPFETGQYTLSLGLDSVTQTAPPDGTVSTGGDATPSDPAQVALTTPNGGAVTLDKGPGSGPPAGGYQVVGSEYSISAPPATAGDPIVLEFTIDSTLLVPFAPPAAYEVFRNGALVPDCSGPAGQAVPDPCVESRTSLGGGDLRIRVLTSQASQWAVALDNTSPSVSFATPNNRVLNTRQVTVEFGANDAGATFECNLDGVRVLALLEPLHDTFSERRRARPGRTGDRHRVEHEQPGVALLQRRHHAA